MSDQCGRRALSALLTPAAIRQRAERLFALAEADAPDHWRLVPERLPEAAALVAEVTRNSYPDLNLPFHSRWRHFEHGDMDLWADLKDRAGRSFADTDAVVRMRIDLTIVSVLLDAGAGADWRFRDDRGGRVVGRSEGLAVASLRMFENGGFSSDPEDDPLRADGERLSRLTAGDLAHHFQVSGRNPLPGLAGRAGLLRALGRLIASRTDVFGDAGPVRLGGLFDHLKGETSSGRITAANILTTLPHHLHRYLGRVVSSSMASPSATSAAIRHSAPTTRRTD